VERFSRRTLLRRGALAGAAVAGGGAVAALLRDSPAVSPPLRSLARGVALGPGFMQLPEQRYEANRARFDETGTPWVRLWATWPVLQPEPGRAPDRGSGARALAALDAQVDAARADGRRVIVTTWQFPRWANGTAGLSSADDAAFELRDRVAGGGDPAGRKVLEYRLAGDLSPRGPWGRWIEFLIARYAGRADALEILNEPNLQLWPQRSERGALTIDSAVAAMMETAATVAARHPRAPLLVAPATGDPTDESRLRTPYDAFTRALLDRLAERRFRPGPRFAWSHHNYADVEGDLAGASNRVGHVRALLAGRWPGWPHGDAAEPGLLITESGARPGVVARNFGLVGRRAALDAQGLVVNRALWRLAAGPEGTGVALVCQYLFVTDRYDSGLCDPDGAPRPAYFAWAAAPTRRA
jgi:hypothetical protein